MRILFNKKYLKFTMTAPHGFHLRRELNAYGNERSCLGGMRQAGG